MKTLKLFLKLLVVFVVLYFLVDFLSFAFVKTTYSTIEKQEIMTTVPKIEIEEAKATYVNGYVKGTITNNSESDIDVCYLVLNSYSERDVNLGTKYWKIENLKQNETREFKITFRYQEVKRISLNMTKEHTGEYETQESMPDSVASFGILMGVIFSLYFLGF